jgi:UDPglucose 6-dehydrogenase
VDAIIRSMEDALGGLAGKTVAVLGLSSRPSSSSVRRSPALAAIRHCLARGARVRAHDPAAIDMARCVLPGVSYCRSPYWCVQGADAVLLATAWDEYGKLDMARVAELMRGTDVFDGRSFLPAQSVAEAGLRYHGGGRRRSAIPVADRHPNASVPAPTG